MSSAPVRQVEVHSSGRTGPAAPVRYRADIDGLRAVSIVAVVLFHIRLPGFAGGYVGVDVFFVISGFLITEQLIAPSDASLRRRLADFYLRRARRILPALIVVLAITTLVAAALFLAPDLQRFGRNLALSAAMLGNLAAWLDGSYFGFAGRFAPIAHLWSIAVEEQFYLSYPLLLLWLQRSAGWRGARVVVIGALALASFAHCVYASYAHPVSNYFLMPTRGWQLLLGALIALGLLRPARRHGVNEALAVLALGTIAVTVHAYGPTLRYPGWHALPPSLAAAALVATSLSRPTAVARLLSLRPLVFTGLISYSLYLWHSPLFECFLYFNLDAPTALQHAMLLATLYLLGVATWFWIERPFRTRRRLASNRTFLLAASGGLAALVAAGAMFYLSGGWPQRFPPEIQELAKVTDRIDFEVPCMNRVLPEIAAGRLCSYGPTDAPVARVVVWGDSHAAVLLEQYRALAESRRLRIYYGIKGGCRPLLGTENWDEDNDWQQTCAGFNAAMAEAVRRIDPDVLILNAFWISPAFDRAARNHPPMQPGKTNLQWALEQTLSRTNSSARTVCAVLTVPTYDLPLPYALAMGMRRDLGDRLLVRTRAEVDAQYAEIDAAIQALQHTRRLRIADPKDLLCPTGKCRYRGDDGRLLYRDGNHLTKAGTRFVAPVLDQCFAGIVAPTTGAAPSR